MQDLYTKNWNINVRKLKEHLNTWRNTLFSWIGKLNIKISIHLKLKT